MSVSVFGITPDLLWQVRICFQTDQLAQTPSLSLSPFLISNFYWSFFFSFLSILLTSPPSFLIFLRNHSIELQLIGGHNLMMTLVFTAKPFLGNTDKLWMYRWKNVRVVHSNVPKLLQDQSERARSAPHIKRVSRTI